MPETVLLTRPKHDLTTSYLHYWTGKLIKEAEKKGIEVIDLEKEKATRENLESYIDKKKPEILVLNGHGSKDRIGGHKNRPVLEKGGNESKSANTAIYARTCKSGADLAEACVGSGAKAYIGYRKDFIVPYNTQKSTKPQRDSLAEPVMEASNEAARNLIKGNKPKKAYRKSQEAYQEKINKVLTTYQLGKDQLLAALLHNKENQVLEE
ncbi:MAG: hypothetical protein SVV03_03770 [Candidatus Nanohaloarchaea archaeon]|nr:hypothetical protein [Candidatus Nanohaloarchaea archaeon]